MSVSKRVRFEVLRRDSHACRYCGGVAPDVKLHVDHVIPVALGGTDDPGNLVTACADCNSGKTSTSPDSVIVEDVKQAALDFKRGYAAALETQAIKIREARKLRKQFAELWAQEAGPADSLPAGWQSTIDHWNAIGLPWEVLEDAVGKAASKTTLRTYDAVYKYMCGIVWSVLKEAANPAPQPAEQDPDALCSCGGDLRVVPIDEGGDGEQCFQCTRSDIAGAGHAEGERAAALRLSATDFLALHIDRRESGFLDLVRWS